MRMGFKGGIKLEFHGAKVTSDGGLLAYRELDDALGLFAELAFLIDSWADRTGIPAGNGDPGGRRDRQQHGGSGSFWGGRP